MYLVYCDHICPPLKEVTKKVKTIGVASFRANFVWELKLFFRMFTHCFEPYPVSAKCGCHVLSALARLLSAQQCFNSKIFDQVQSLLAQG